MQLQTCDRVKILGFSCLLNDVFYASEIEKVFSRFCQSHQQLANQLYSNPFFPLALFFLHFFLSIFNFTYLAVVEHLKYFNFVFFQI